MPEDDLAASIATSTARAAQVGLIQERLMARLGNDRVHGLGYFRRELVPAGEGHAEAAMKPIGELARGEDRISTQDALNHPSATKRGLTYWDGVVAFGLIGAIIIMALLAYSSPRISRPVPNSPTYALPDRPSAPIPNKPVAPATPPKSDEPRVWVPTPDGGFKLQKTPPSRQQQ